MEIRLPILLACLLAAVPVYAEELTLSHAVELALEHAPAMQAAEAGRDAAREDRQIGLARLYPSITANGSFQHSNQRTDYAGQQNVFLSQVRSDEKSGSVRVVQPLFDLERLAGYRQGVLSSEAGELHLRIERQRLTLEVAKTYLDCMIAEAAVKTAQAREEAANEMVAQAQAGFDLGLYPISDKLDAEARRDLARADYLAASNQLDQARSGLASLLGRRVDTMAFPALAEELTAPQHSRLTEWEALAAGHAIPVLISQKQLQTTKAGRGQAEGAALPKIEAFAEMSYTRASETSVGPASKLRNRAVGVQLSVPLYAGGGQSAQLRKSAKEVVQAEFQLQEDIRTARLSVRQSFLAFASAVSRLRAMERAMFSAREAAKGAHMGRKVGLRSMAEVLDADERRFNAEKGLVEAKAGVVFAELQLLASIGRLDQMALPERFGNAAMQIASH